MPPKRKAASTAAPSKRPRFDNQTGTEDHIEIPSNKLDIESVCHVKTNQTNEPRKSRSQRRSNAKSPVVEEKTRATERSRDYSGDRTQPSNDRKRRKGKNNENKPPNSTASSAAVPKDDIKDEALETEEQYWLMKAEPNDRFENGHNVKFSIDDLAAATEPEPWDGVRNYAARNNMRTMRKDDLAFFYHSNCASPAIVGVMRIVEEYTPDESAFNPGHPYYDPKSQRDNPKWDIVRVEFVKKFEKEITLKMVNENAASSKELAEMDLLKYKRLSVNKVKPREWNFILQWAGESLDIGKSQG